MEFTMSALLGDENKMLSRLVRTVTLVAMIALFSAPNLTGPPLAFAQSTQPEVSREIVENIQRMLTQQGYTPGPTDGLPGRSTAIAIRDFQEANGLPVTGTATKALYEVLLSKGSTDPAHQKYTSRTSDKNYISHIDPPSSPKIKLNLKTETGISLEQTAETQQSNQIPINPIVGTQWAFIDDGGASFIGRFDERGQFEGPGDSRLWEWRSIHNGVEIVFNNRMGETVRRLGRFVDSNWLNGSGIASNGEKWSWVAERIILNPNAGTPKTVW